MNESSVMKAVGALLVIGVAWTMGSVSTLSANDKAQEVHIQKSIEADSRLLSKQGIHGERLASLESEQNGLKVSMGIIIKNQDRILAQLERHK